MSIVPDFDRVPHALRERDQWVVWRYVTKGGRRTKVPFVAMGTPQQHAAVNDSSTWRSFDAAKAAYKTTRGAAAYDGVGYVLTAGDGFVGVDIDKCLDAQARPSGPAQHVLSTLDSYAEITPSGEGLRVFVRGQLPEGAGGRNDRARGVEIYQEGRFLTVTGREFRPGSTIEERTTEVAALYHDLFAEMDAEKAGRAAKAAERKAAQAQQAPPSPDLADDDLLDRMFRSENGARIRSLWDGSTAAHNGDASGADLALCNHLAFWTGADPERMDALFRRSGLMRPKWDERHGADGRTYGRMTLDLAVRDCVETYQGPTGAAPGGGGTFSAPVRVGSINASAASADPTSETEAGHESENEEDAKLRRRLQARERKQRRGDAAKLADGLPVIECNHRHLRDKSGDALGALVGANEPPEVFARGGRLVRVGIDEKGHPGIEYLSGAALRGRLARVANFVSTSDDRGTVPVAPPADVVEDVLALPTWPGVPPLAGIVTAPVVSSGGELVTAPGYLAGAELFYYETDRRPVPSDLAEPTDENLGAARALLVDEMLADFPFVDDAGRAHAVALLLLPFLRPYISGATPLHLIDAPTPGSGKGLLVEAVTGVFIAGGATLTPGDVKDDEEWRKRITTGLKEGGSHLWFDNINRRVDSGSLAAALTARVWRDRLLGANEEISLPVRQVWIGTGNNTQLSDEITRRTIWIRLDPRMERPWDRDGFRHPDLRGWVREHRPRLLAAVICLLRRWIGEGRPLWDEKPLGSFEAWSRVLGGVLGVAGVAGFLSNRDQLFEKLDPERAKWAGLFAAWHEKFQSAACGIADIYPLAIDAELVDGNEVKARGEKNVLGRLLRQHEGRVVSGYRVTQTGTKDRAAQYVCERVGPDGSPVVADTGLFSPPAPAAAESMNQNESPPARTRGVTVFHTASREAQEMRTSRARACTDSSSFIDSSHEGGEGEEERGGVEI